MKEVIKLKKKLLSLLLAFLMVFGMLPETALANVGGQAYDFVDMPNNWSTTSLIKAVDNGLLKGYADGGKSLINADAPLKRAEMAAVINRAFGAVKTAVLDGITDVPSTAWYASDMGKALIMGTFMKDTTMRPESNITRQEAFVVLARAFKISSDSLEYKALEDYLDKADIAAWAKKDLNAMVEAGYVQGSGSKLNPNANISRAEFATVLDNLVKQYIDIPGEITDVSASGNVLIRVPGVTLKNLTIKGDLIIADGVGEGDVTLDNVKVEGRTVVRGNHSIIILRAESALKEGIITGYASKIIVDNGATVDKIIISGSDVKVEGNGTVKDVDVKEDGDNASITTPNTKIETAKGAKGVTAAGGAPVPGGTNVMNNNVGTWIVITGSLGGKESSPTAIVSAINIATDVDVTAGVENDAMVKVTLTTVTTGADIYYTLDGSIPTVSSTKYTVPFSVDTDNVEGETVTIKAIGVKPGYTNSAVAEQEIVFKATPTEFAGGDGTLENPYKVVNAEQLDNVRNHLDKYFIQTENIDLAAYLAEGGDGYNEGKGWEPIGVFVSGDTGNPFTGSYNGNSKTISNLNINRQDKDYVGLFEYIKGGYIYNISLSDIDVKGKDVVGGLVGYQMGGKIADCSVSGSINATGSRVGGLIGYSYEVGEVIGCYSTASVEGFNDVGGLIGYNYSRIEKCYATGNVKGNSSTTGGLIASNYGVITDCYATGSVYGLYDEVGGLVGLNAYSGAQIINSFATGQVTGGGSNIGGLVGENKGSAIVDKCYATGQVTGGTKVGGLIGETIEGATTTNSYWDTETSGQATSAGGTGYSTSAMIMETNSVPIYVDWDFVNTWAIDTNPRSYPYLEWQGDVNIPYPLRVQLTIAEPTVTKERQYDGTTVVQVTAGELIGVVAGNDVSVNATANFNDKEIGTNKTITVIYTLSGSDANKYTAPVSWTTNDGVITKKALGFSGLSYKTVKEYDGTTAVTLLTLPTLSGVVEGENVDVDVDINYDTALAGINKRITTIITISGEHSGNYFKPINHYRDDCEIVAAAAPTPGNGGVITTESITDTTLTLNWTKASDNYTTEANLKYYVYQSDSNNIDTVQNAEANGILLNDRGTLDINTYDVNSLNAGTTYYFNVIVSDETGYKAAYTTINKAWKSSAVDLISIAGQTDNSPGGGTGETADIAATWQVNVDNAKATLALADIAVADGATFRLFADMNYTTEIEGEGTLALSVGDTTVYIRVDAEDTTTVKFFEVTIKRSIPAQSGSPEFTVGTPATYGTTLTVGPGTLTTTTRLWYWWYRSIDEVYDASYDSVAYGVSTMTYKPVEADIGKYLIVIVVTPDASGSAILVTDAPVAKAAGPAFTTEYEGTFPVEATSINLTRLGVSTGNLEAAVAIDGTNYADYVPLVVDGDGKATITGLTGVTASTKVKVRVKETSTHKAGADKEITVAEQVIIPIGPMADLLDAYSGSGFGFIGVLYTTGGSIYYNQVDTTGTWGTESLIGTGTEGRMAIDSTGNPHVAYTTGGKIGYRMYNGSYWTDETLIVSNNEGSCSKPDIAVDNNRYAHITYTDTQGYHVGKDENKDDIMYANNTSGSFIKHDIFDGWYDYPSGSNYYYDLYNWGSQISLDSNGDYYIIGKNQSRYGANDTMTYSVKVKSVLGSGSTEGNKTDYYGTYDLSSSGSKVIALYNHSGHKTAELTIDGANITFANINVLPGGTVSSVATDGIVRVVGGEILGKLQTFYNGTAMVYDDTVKIGSKISVVNVGGNFYAIYTGSDEIIKMIEILTP